MVRFEPKIWLRQIFCSWKIFTSLRGDLGIFFPPVVLNRELQNRGRMKIKCPKNFFEFKNKCRRQGQKDQNKCKKLQNKRAMITKTKNKLAKSIKCPTFSLSKNSFLKMPAGLDSPKRLHKNQ
jgi:hypothetical protein